MSWVKRVRNAIPFIAKRESTETLWHKCKSCHGMIFLKEFEDNQSVCPKCDHHGRIGPQARFEALFDEGSWKTLPMPDVVEDPLTFKDIDPTTRNLHPGIPISPVVTKIEAKRL